MNITINEFLADPVGTTENDCFGFFDWFCTDRGLKSRMLKLKGLKACAKLVMFKEDEDGEKKPRFFSVFDASEVLARA